ncbi:acyl-CoA N-acyltransferase [Byssothecium circinans]|uniref:Histone acetyltransferase type B catalytic subunit n=1 Tax=Byssothecium circinans TaxID=147558 RepID=A0A6A5UAV2_9PLEO|nr:acyl-CoA N-acyltransferase [Byssothecium circinans]
MAGLDLEEWITNATECFEINLVRPKKEGEPVPVFAESFPPAFTYLIFNEKEDLVGYKNPSINLTFRANDLKPSITVAFDEKLDLSNIMQEGEEQIDLVKIWEQHLPAYVFNPSEAPEAPSENDPTSMTWKPPGSLLHSFALHGKQYEVWSTNMSDPAARQIWDNMRILTHLYIEGATYPELDDQWSTERWTLYLMYEVTPIDMEEGTSSYTLAGFSTSYRYWIFPTLEVMRATNSLPSPPSSANGDASTYPKPRLTIDPKTQLVADRINALETPSRERISQFLILPPYQGQSLGAQLYETIFADLVKKPFIYEIPVEDPSEEFDAMRDYSDIVYLRKIPEFNSLTLPSTMPPESMHKSAPIPRDQILGNDVNLDDLRHKCKIVPRQFNRMLELHLFSTIKPFNRNKNRITRKDKSSNENDRKYYFWRLALKDRIYRQSADVLEQIEDPSERVEKLELAVDSQQQEYEEREEGIRRRMKWSKGEIKNSEGSQSRGKRKRVVVEEDDDDGDEWEDLEEEATSSKKQMNRFR